MAVRVWPCNCAAVIVPALLQRSNRSGIFRNGEHAGRQLLDPIWLKKIARGEFCWSGLADALSVVQRVVLPSMEPFSNWQPTSGRVPTLSLMINANAPGRAHRADPCYYPSFLFIL